MAAPDDGSRADGSRALGEAVDVREIERGASALVQAFDAALEELGSTVPPAQLRALLSVERLGRPSLGDLAAELGASASATSRLCDRMQAAGLLERLTADDRRGITLSLTASGRRLAGWVSEQRCRVLSGLLAGMSPAGRAALGEGLRELRESARSRRIS